MILVVGLSPAWQRTLEFRALRPGKVNRAVRVSETASGKGVNVARVAMQLGAPVRLLTVAGGARGRQLVESMKTQRLPVNVVRVEAETRICQTLIADRSMTELVEEAGALSPGEVAKVITQFDRELRRASLVVLTGSLPTGCGEDFYERLIRRTRRPVLMDAQRSQLLNAVRARPFAVKINRDELAAVSSLRRDLVEWLIISDGARCVTAWNAGQRFTFTPPRVKAANTIGSGDAMSAGIAVTLARGASMPEAVRFGVACGAANAVTSRPGHIRRADVRRFESMLDKPVVGR
jgi:tagatose 6-phosphate kinase